MSERKLNINRKNAVVIGVVGSLIAILMYVVIGELPSSMLKSKCLDYAGYSETLNNVRIIDEQDKADWADHFMHTHKYLDCMEVKGDIASLQNRTS